MPALRVQVHLHGNSSLLQGCIVTERVLYAVHMVILVLQQKRRRRLAGNISRNIRIQLETVISNGQMAWIKSHRKIRAATYFVGRVGSWVQTLCKMSTDRCYQMSACRKPEHSNLVRIDMPLRGVEADQPHCPLRIFQGHRGFRIRP